MLPFSIIHFNQIHDKFVEILKKNDGTVILKGLWFTNTDKLLTSDPTNAHYILSTNFANYPKGPLSKRIFQVQGDFLFNSDHEEWKIHRKTMRAFFNDRRCMEATVKVVRDSIEKGLIPFLDHVSKQGMVVDLQDLFTRLMLDSTCTLATGYNPSSLSIGFPETPLATAMDIANDTVFQRNLIPESMWKLQSWLGLGVENKMSKALHTLNNIATEYIKMKKDDIKGNVEGFDALKFFMIEKDTIRSKTTQAYNFLRDIVIVLNAGGRDTTGACLSWLFWLLSKNPSSESKIREELIAILPKDEVRTSKLFSVEELNKLPYLHGAFCETLRLYPPAPYQSRAIVQSDILPSGHHVNPKMTIVLSWYALGRMKSIWGNDALEFKPERWISENGQIKHDLSNKALFAFSTGPRVCPGKNDAFTRMKAITASIIHNYNVKVVPNHPVTPNSSIILTMKHGIKVKVTKRCT
uniref:CYP96A68 n=1 Tax=Maesa lanceolata TaxID=992730 RepID=A0A0B4L0K6_MAELA|nr:CYP96A68 [Maesa lanceolata]